MSITTNAGQTFTPTIHSSIPSNLEHSSIPLRHPFVAVITGAGKGLGYHIALAYATAGASGISISSRTLSDLTKLESEIVALGKGTEVLQTVCDVQKDEDVETLFEQVKKKWGRVDAVIANAGVISHYVSPSSSSLSSSTPPASNLPIGLPADADWHRVLSTNLHGVWRITRSFLPLLESTTDGPQTLICSTSLAAHSADSQFTPTAYNVSKLAACRLMEHVGNDHGGRGVVAIALHPGAVVTPQTVGHKGDIWSALLSDDQGLAGAMCVWLSREKRTWLNGRYVSCNWDVDELEGMRDDIVREDKLKFRMVV